MAEAITDLPVTDHGVEKVHRQKTEPLWHHWLPLLFVVLAACAEPVLAAAAALR